MRIPLAALVLVASTLAAPVARAQTTNADPKNVARALAEHGKALYNAGRYAEAIDSFEHAERLYHAPTLVFSLALAYVASGKLVEGRALLVRVRDEQLAPDAPPAFLKVKEDAPGQIQALDRRIPTLQILVRGGGGKSLRVSLDDVETKDYRPDTPIPVNPGLRRITVVPSGGVGVTRSVEAKEGARLSVEIELAGAAPAIVPVPVAAPPPLAAARPWRVPAFTFIGLGAAALALGIGTGVYTAVASGRLGDECPSGKCSPSLNGDIRLARGTGITSTVAFIAAPVLAVPGIVLLAVSPRAKTSVKVGVGTIGVEGVF